MVILIVKHVETKTPKLEWLRQFLERKKSFKKRRNNAIKIANINVKFRRLIICINL